jgi:hypothetical protein
VTLRFSSPGLRAALLVIGLLPGCPSGDVNQPAPAAPAAAGAPAGRAPTARERGAPPAPAPWRIPVGPKLPIEPGKGLGPIRFGANIDTIERLIGEPCEQKLEEPGGVTVCRYSAQAVEFFLEGGKVTRMRVHRLGRPFKPEPKLDFGIFNGGFIQGGGIGMLMGPTQELLGQPKAVRKLEGEALNNPYSTVEIHEYDNFSLEYDTPAPDRVLLGGVTLTAPK